MKTKLIFSLGGILVGSCLGAIAGWYATKRKYDYDMSEALATAEYYEKRLRNSEKERGDIRHELDGAKDELHEVYAAINQFCDEKTAGCVKDLVNSRRYVTLMREQGVNEETMTERLIYHDYERVISDEGYDPTYGRYKRTPETAADDTDGDSTPYDVDPENGDVIIGDLRLSEQIVTHDTPYLIDEDEFCANTNGYDQLTFIYYAADDILSDTADNDTLDQATLGVDELLQAFTPKDVDVLYIRDETKCVEYEVIWEDGAYRTIVLGLNPDGLVLLPRIFKEG